MAGFVLQYKNCIVTKSAGYCIVLQYMEVKKNCIAIGKKIVLQVKSLNDL